MPSFVTVKTSPCSSKSALQLMSEFIVTTPSVQSECPRQPQNVEPAFAVTESVTMSAIL